MSEKETAGTPRTDAVAEMLPDAEVIAGRLVYMGQATERVSAEFARQLEREVASLTTQRDELQKRIGYTAVPLVAGGANIDQTSIVDSWITKNSPQGDDGLVSTALAIELEEKLNEARDAYDRLKAAGEICCNSMREQLRALRPYVFEQCKQHEGQTWPLLITKTQADAEKVCPNCAYLSQEKRNATRPGDGIEPIRTGFQRELAPAGSADWNDAVDARALATGTAQATECETNGTEGLRAELDAAKRALQLAHEHMQLYLVHYTPSHNVYETVIAALAAKSPLG